jgi:hypothetical protein
MEAKDVDTVIFTFLAMMGFTIRGKGGEVIDIETIVDGCTISDGDIVVGYEDGVWKVGGKETHRDDFRCILNAIHSGKIRDIKKVMMLYLKGTAEIRERIANYHNQR